MTDEPRSIPKHPVCPGTRRDGSPCRAPGILAGWCFAHHPDRAADRARARRRGGAGKAATARAEKLVPVLLRPTLDGLLGAFAEVKEGTMDPKVATALATLASAIVRVYGAGVAEEKLAELEKALDAAQGGGVA